VTVRMAVEMPRGNGDSSGKLWRHRTAYGVSSPGRPPFSQVVFIQSQKVCQVSTVSTLLEAAESNESQIPYGCRQGLCGTCATRVLSGAVQMDVEAGLTAEQKDAGYVLPCVSRAKATVVLAA
jgi:ferredoxin